MNKRDQLRKDLNVFPRFEKVNLPVDPKIDNSYTYFGKDTFGDWYIGPLDYDAKGNPRGISGDRINADTIYFKSLVSLFRIIEE